MTPEARLELAQADQAAQAGQARQAEALLQWIQVQAGQTVLAMTPEAHLESVQVAQAGQARQAEEPLQWIQVQAGQTVLAMTPEAHLESVQADQERRAALRSLLHVARWPVPRLAPPKCWRFRNL